MFSFSKSIPKQICHAYTFSIDSCDQSSLESSSSQVGINLKRNLSYITYPMANMDVEVGDRTGPRNKTKWWHPSTQQNNSNIPDNVQILLDRKEMGQNLSTQVPPSIYKVPSSVRNPEPDYFKPQVVSIGPLHREDRTLQEFEEKKTIYLHHLLQHLNTSPRHTLDTCWQWVNASIPRIRECYGGMITYTDVELAQMMVMDACFILSFLFLSDERQRFTSRNAILTHSIFSDLVLLENQIPFFVLQGIFNHTLSNLQTDSLTSGVLRHLQFLIPFKGINYNDVTSTTQPHHILGLLQKYFHPRDTNILSTRSPLEMPNRPTLKMLNHSALDLDKAGVKFKPNKDANWILAISFSSSRFECFRKCWGNRTLRMPALCVDDNTELFLRNIIAYEQCTPEVPDYVTSYVSAIDMLLDTKEDLSKLVKSKVLSNNLGSNKDATKMLNSISKQFVFEEFYYMDQWERLNHYYEGYWPRNIAWLKRKYFSSPWNIIALLAAIILFSLAIVQVILRIIK